MLRIKIITFHNCLSSTSWVNNIVALLITNTWPNLQSKKYKSIALSLFAVNSISLSAKRRVFQPSGRDSHALIASDCSSLFQLPSYFCFFRTRCQLPVTDPHIRIRWFSIRVIFFCAAVHPPRRQTWVKFKWSWLFGWLGRTLPSPPPASLGLASLELTGVEFGSVEWQEKRQKDWEIKCESDKCSNGRYPAR